MTAICQRQSHCKQAKYLNIDVSSVNEPPAAPHRGHWSVRVGKLSSDNVMLLSDRSRGTSLDGAKACE